MMDSQDAELTRLRNELAAARETNTRLNKRAQSAEAALCDLKKVLDRMAANTEKGTPWVGGSLGRAFLAHFNSQLTADLLALRETVRVLGRVFRTCCVVKDNPTPQAFLDYSDALVAFNANPGARAAVENNQ
jgi:hypothetical protein